MPNYGRRTDETNTRHEWAAVIATALEGDGHVYFDVDELEPGQTLEHLRRCVMAAAHRHGVIVSTHVEPGHHLRAVFARRG